MQRSQRWKVSQMPNFEDDSGNCHAPDPNGVACYKSRIGCPIHPRQKKQSCAPGAGSGGWAMTDKIGEIRARHSREERWRNGPSMLCPQSHDDCATLLIEVERLREALSWYADPLNHSPVKCRSPGDPDPSVVFLMELPPIINDGGRKAREALGVKS